MEGQSALRRTTANVDVLDERYSPAEPMKWQNPETAIGSALLDAHRIDTYAVETTGWLVAGPTFESTNIRTAVAFGPVGLTVPDAFNLLVPSLCPRVRDRGSQRW